MDKIRIRKEMADLIESLRQYIDMLAKGDSISQSELKDVLKKTTDLHRNAVILDYLTNLKAAVDRGEVNPLKALDLKEEKEPELIRRGPESKAEVKPEELKAEEVAPDPLISEANPPVAEVLIPKTPKENTEEKKKQEKKETPEIRIQPQKQAGLDLFGGELPPVVPDPLKERSKEKQKEKEKPKEDKSLVSKLQKKPITDLKSAIGINEKFQFINELFGGNMTEYNIAINQVNICSSREEAEVYLDTLRDLYKWQQDNETVIAFSELVERRFL
jgi:glucan-binding YG repeat protein